MNTLRHTLISASAALVLMIASGCELITQQEQSTCIPGQSVECACPDGSMSAQICADDGSSFDACVCGASADEAMGYIVGGEQSREFAATGALMRGEEPICTATLVSRTSALTAAHCVSRLASFELGFRLGVDPRAPTVARGISSITIHPSYVDFDPAQQWTFANGHDLAILQLAEPIDEVSPAVLYLDNAEAILGQPTRLVGYGATDVVAVAGRPTPIGGGIRRASTVRFDVLTAQALRYLFAGMGACNGDSGGPAFTQIGAQWYQVGVTSWGDTACEQYGFYQRLDLHAEWLRANIELADRQVSCDADQVCDGQCSIDDDCVALLCPGGSCPAQGGSCSADGQCERSCGSVDPDCETEQGNFDSCQAYGLHNNGRCDPQCPNDPECSHSVAPAPQCHPTSTRAVQNVCQYIDNTGRVCQEVPLTGLAYVPQSRACVALDAAGQQCGWAPASFRYDPYTNVCTYIDPAGNICGQAYPYCTYGGCSC